MAHNSYTMCIHGLPLPPLPLTPWPVALGLWVYISVSITTAYIYIKTHGRVNKKQVACNELVS